MTGIDGRELVSPRAYAERGIPHDRFTDLRRLEHLHLCEPHGFDSFYPVVRQLTAEIAEAIQDILQPQGVGVMIEAEHSCMTMRGVNTPGSNLVTSRLMGVLRDDARTREE